MFAKELANCFVSTPKISMQCVVNWIPLRICVRSRDTQPHPSIRQKWRILQLNKSIIGTTNAVQCQVPVWWDHTIGPRTAKNGDNCCTALKRNMGRSAHGNLVHWVNLQKRRRAGSSCSHFPSYIFSRAVVGCCSTSCIDNTSNKLILRSDFPF